MLWSGFFLIDAFCKKFSSRVGNRYFVYTKDLRKDEETLLVPVYDRTVMFGSEMDEVDGKTKKHYVSQFK